MFIDQRVYVYRGFPRLQPSLSVPSRWMTHQAPKVSKYQVVATLHLTSNNIQCNLILIYSSLRTSIVCVFLLKTEPILIPNLRQKDFVLNTSAFPLMLHETSVEHLSINKVFLRLIWFIKHRISALDHDTEIMQNLLMF